MAQQVSALYRLEFYKNKKNWKFYTSYNGKRRRNNVDNHEADSTRTTATNLSQERLTNINIWPTSGDREGDNSSHTLLQRVLLNSHNRNFNCAQDKITPEVV
ncbi:unnamed protein product [Leptidea sinapis]|uniref:Uncharacterized protein n=1 Tax=Leptidea sinapis TaxID=189913 RepID=A0A5E4QUJ9_9NEOP|nr:unnamed protein product [Leptidea sinapis]